MNTFFRIKNKKTNKYLQRSMRFGNKARIYPSSAHLKNSVNNIRWNEMEDNLDNLVIEEVKMLVIDKTPLTTYMEEDYIHEVVTKEQTKIKERNKRIKELEEELTNLKINKSE